MTKQQRVQNMRILGSTFLTLYAQNPRQVVNMSESQFHTCGTIACHAGWFAVARNISRIGNDGQTFDYSYGDSASDMARFLGFKHSIDLATYAHQNPEVWGNSNGRYMFSCEEAFGIVAGGKISLKDIGIHWLKVADRYEALGRVNVEVSV